jgi:hypothetical protein
MLRSMRKKPPAGQATVSTLEPRRSRVPIDGNYQSEQECRNQMRRLAPTLQELITSEDRIKIVCEQKRD